MYGSEQDAMYGSEQGQNGNDESKEAVSFDPTAFVRSSTCCTSLILVCVANVFCHFPLFLCKALSLYPRLSLSRHLHMCQVFQRHSPLEMSKKLREVVDSRDQKRQQVRGLVQVRVQLCDYITLNSTFTTFRMPLSIFSHFLLLRDCWQ